MKNLLYRFKENVVVLLASAVIVLFGGTLTVLIIVVGEINSSRVVQCEHQNQRHDRTVNSLQRTYSLMEKTETPDQVKASKGQLAYDITLIQDLQPKKDCSNL